MCVYTYNFKMKIKILLLYYGLALPIICTAENLYPGIFSSAEDYQKNRVSIVADTTQHKALRIDNFFFRPYIWIKTSRGEQKILKKEVFAVRMPDKKIYKIVDNDNYLLLDASNICIYSKEKEISIPKATVHSTRYKRIKVSEYFFSTTIADSVQNLNTTNIRLALLKDRQLDRKLTSHFPTNKSLLTRSENGQFEINVFLNTIK